MDPVYALALHCERIPLDLLALFALAVAAGAAISLRGGDARFARKVALRGGAVVAAYALWCALDFLQKVERFS